MQMVQDERCFKVLGQGGDSAFKAGAHVLRGKAGVGAAPRFHGLLYAAVLLAVRRGEDAERQEPEERFPLQAVAGDIKRYGVGPVLKASSLL